MDAVYAIAAITAFYIAFRGIGLWTWFWATIGVALGGWELYSVLTTKLTLSQAYWQFAETSPWWWAPALLVAVGGIGLALHLVWRRIRKR